MEWVRHDKLAAEHGVKLCGWPPELGSICNPSDLTQVGQLQKVVNALNSRDCHWETLSQEEWDAKKQAANEANAAAKKRKRGKGKGKGKASGEDSAEDDVGEENNHEQEQDQQSNVPFSGFMPTASLYPPNFDPITGGITATSDVFATPDAFMFDPTYQFAQGSSMDLGQWT